MSDRALDLGMIVRYDGRLAEVQAIGEGRTITLRFVGEDPCPTCKREATVSLLEHAPLLQDKLEPVDTVRAR
jgi:hypothetical protein